MSNPMLSQLNQSQISQNLAPIKNMMNMIRSSKDPQSMFTQLMQQNPQMRSIMQYVNSNGGDPKSAFYAMAKEKGINPEDILSQLR